MNPHAATQLAYGLADMGTTQALLAIAAVVFLIFLMNFSTRRRRAGLSNPRENPRGAEADTARVMRLKREMEQLLVELNEFAREVNGQVDTRFRKLEQSIADADRRIAELRRLSGEATSGDTRDDSVLRANREAAEGVRDRLAQVRSAVAAANDPPRPTRSSESVSREDAVYQLADGGNRPVDIARALKCTVGEVELILNLRDRS